MNKLRHEDGNLDTEIAEALSGDAFALYGAGQLGRMALDMWPKNRPRPQFFVDAHKTGEYCGLPVYSPDDRLPAGVIFLLSAFKMPAGDARQIFDRLGQSLLLTVYDYFEEVMPAEFGNGWRNLAADNETLKRAEKARSVYADDLSGSVHDCACAWRYRRELCPDYPVAPEEDKYNLSRLGRSGVHYDLVIDGGTFDLHTLEMLADGGASWDRAIAFEADPARFEICTAKSNGAVEVHPLALSDRDGEAGFLATGLLSARLVGAGFRDDPRVVSVRIAMLDSLGDLLSDLSGKKVLLKLHIEGAELSALRGAEKLLRNTACDVLLNLSHDESSLLDLPVYLGGFGRHDIYLRSHSLFGEGLTLFARCKDF